MKRLTKALITCALGGLLLLSPLVIAHWDPPGDPGAQQPATQPVTSGPIAAPPISGQYTLDFRKLTPKEINRLRYMELRGMRLRTDLPDRVTVKIAKPVVDDFLIQMEGHEDFRGEETRRAFRRLMPPQKLHQIARYMREDYADKVEILTDPEIFVEFKKNVMPQVLRGCSTNGCHLSTAGDGVKFWLFKDPKKTTDTTYANYVILNDLGHGSEWLINRARVSDSLLLTYMLPVEDVRPELRHPTKLPGKPLFRNRGAMGYKRIERWISELKNPPSDYGVHLVKPAFGDEPPPIPMPPTSQPQP